MLPRAAEPFPRDVGAADTRLGWRLVSPLMQQLYPPVSLGETAENVAERYGVDRGRQDRFTLRSHQRAAAAAAAGVLAEEIIPVSAPGGEVTADEGIRPELTLDDLAARKPAFRPDGTVTGGNSSPLNDGAAGLLLMSERDPADRQVRGHRRGRGAPGLHGDRPGARDDPAAGPGRLAGGRRGAARAAATMCIGVGQGIATLWEAA